MEKIVFIDTPRFTQDVEIEGKLYRIGLDYSVTSTEWLFSIEDSETGQAVSGVPMFPGFPLLFQYRPRFTFNGDFFALPLSFTGNNAVQTEQVSYDDAVDGHVGLFYISESEAQEVAAATGEDQ